MYTITLTGQCINEVSWDDALNNFSELFQLETSASEELLLNAPLVIKRDLEEATALALKEAIEAAGFEATIDSEATSPEPVIEQTEEKAPGFFDKIKTLFKKSA